MAQVEKIKVLNIDGNAKAVDDMSDQVKQLVEVYDEWNQEEADLRNKLMMVQSAKNDLSRQIISKVREDEAEQESDASENQGHDGENTSN